MRAAVYVHGAGVAKEWNHVKAGFLSNALLRDAGCVIPHMWIVVDGLIFDLANNADPSVHFADKHDIDIMNDAAMRQTMRNVGATDDATHVVPEKGISTITIAGSEIVICSEEQMLSDIRMASDKIQRYIGRPRNTSVPHEIDQAVMQFQAAAADPDAYIAGAPSDWPAAALPGFLEGMMQTKTIVDIEIDASQRGRGIGVTFEIDKSDLFVSAVEEGGEGCKAGLRRSDYVLLVGSKGTSPLLGSGPKGLLRAINSASGGEEGALAITVLRSIDQERPADTIFL